MSEIQKGVDEEFVVGCSQKGLIQAGKAKHLL